MRVSRVIAAEGDILLNKSGIIGWKVDRSERPALLRDFPPVYRDVVADHVTLDAHAGPGARLPGEKSGRIVGMADDGRGVQALVVAIDGTTDRPGGGTYHITWSLDRGRRPVESNHVLARQGWRRLSEPRDVSLHPARF
jgi:hypothetical protein